MSDISYKLHLAAFLGCLGMGVVVFFILMYSLIQFRKSKGMQATHFHKHLGIEILWTTIPFLILVALAIPAMSILQQSHHQNVKNLHNSITPGNDKEHFTKARIEL